MTEIKVMLLASYKEYMKKILYPSNKKKKVSVILHLTSQGLLCLVQLSDWHVCFCQFQSAI